MKCYVVIDIEKNIQVFGSRAAIEATLGVPISTLNKAFGERKQAKYVWTDGTIILRTHVIRKKNINRINYGKSN